MALNKLIQYTDNQQGAVLLKNHCRKVGFQASLTPIKMLNLNYLNRNKWEKRTY